MTPAASATTLDVVTNGRCVVVQPGDCLNRLAACSDWVMPGLAEARWLTGLEAPDASADFYLARGASVVVTMPLPGDLPAEF